jgi:uncharacterized membrane protein
MLSALSAAVNLPIDEVAGLPLHPLVVHAVVVLVPLAAVGLIVMALSGSRSKRYSPAVLVVAGLGAASAFLAMLSGQAFAKSLGLSNQQHFEFGEYLPWAALILFAVTVVLAVMDRQSGGNRNVLGTIVAIATIVIAVGAIVLTVLTGHSGAVLVWG